jgi:phage terminase large subunit-like protein
LQLSGENFIDYHDCYNWLVELVEKYEILPLMCGYDRYSSQYLVQDLERYGFRTDDVYQGTNLTPVINEFSGLIKDGKIRIGDNNLLKMHFFDSAIKTEAENNRKRLIKLNASTSHIDGMAALLDALCVRMKWYDTYGEQLKNEG